jgi:hypothetical protein
MTTAPPPPARPASALARLARLGAIAVVLLAGAYVLRLYFGLARGPAPATTSPPAGGDDLPAAALAAVPAGPWSLGDQPWDLRSSQMAKPEAIAWLDGPAPPSAGRPANPLEGALVALVTPRAERRLGPDGVIVYALDQPALRLRALCRREGGEERLLAARAAFPERQHWRVMELRPAASRAGGPSAAARLLPWPKGSDALAVRRDEAGETVAEMVRVPLPLAALLGDLQTAGWAVTRNDDRLTWRGPAGQGGQGWVTTQGKAETVILAIRSVEARP